MFCLAEPELPIQFQKMEETTNQIGLALERKEEEEGPGRFSTAGQRINQKLSVGYWSNVVDNKEHRVSFGPYAALAKPELLVFSAWGPDNSMLCFRVVPGLPEPALPERGYV